MRFDGESTAAFRQRMGIEIHKVFSKEFNGNNAKMGTGKDKVVPDGRWKGYLFELKSNRSAALRAARRTARATGLKTVAFYYVRDGATTRVAAGAVYAKSGQNLLKLSGRNATVFTPLKIKISVSSSGLLKARLVAGAGFGGAGGGMGSLIRQLTR